MRRRSRKSVGGVHLARRTSLVLRSLNSRRHSLLEFFGALQTLQNLYGHAPRRAISMRRSPLPGLRRKLTLIPCQYRSGSRFLRSAESRGAVKLCGPVAPRTAESSLAVPRHVPDSVSARKAPARFGAACWRNVAIDRVLSFNRYPTACSVVQRRCDDGRRTSTVTVVQPVTVVALRAPSHPSARCPDSVGCR
jgi:hypothetical protein